jgi:RNAse (barnase) inhibitor barstar
MNAMRMIELDGTEWRSVSDFYGALIAALGAPEGYARNINAVMELMVWDNDVPISPFIVRVSKARTLPAEVREEVRHFQDALRSAQAESIVRRGFDVDVNFDVAVE